MASPTRANIVGITKGWPSVGESDVAHNAFIQNFVDGFAIVDRAMRLANHSRPLGGRKVSGS